MRFSFWFCFDFFCGTILVFLCWFFVGFHFTYFVLFFLFLLRIRPVFPLRCVLVNNFHFSVNLWAFVCISLSKCLPFVPLRPLHFLLSLSVFHTFHAVWFMHKSWLPNDAFRHSNAFVYTPTNTLSTLSLSFSL